MTGKSRGPSFKRRMIRLAECPACHGKAVVQGVFYELDCDTCNASGWVDGWTGQALPLPELATQLGMNLRALIKQVEQLKEPRPSGPEALYQEGNRLGAGGTNYTGD